MAAGVHFANTCLYNCKNIWKGEIAKAGKRHLDKKKQPWLADCLSGHCFMLHILTMQKQTFFVCGFTSANTHHAIPSSPLKLITNLNVFFVILNLSFVLFVFKHVYVSYFWLTWFRDVWKGQCVHFFSCRYYVPPTTCKTIFWMKIITVPWRWNQHKKKITHMNFLLLC